MGKVTDLDSVRRSEKPALIKTSNVPLSADVRKARAHSYRLRAEVLRAVSEDVISPETSRTLVGLAKAYDRLASALDHTHTL